MTYLLLEIIMGSLCEMPICRCILLQCRPSGILLAGNHCGSPGGQHLSWAWPVNAKAEALLEAADWTDFSPVTPAQHDVQGNVACE